MFRVSRLRGGFGSAVTTAVTFALLSSVCLPPAFAQSEPAERGTATLTRTSASPLQLRDELSKNVFRPEVRQVDYQVDVPYQDTEEYEVQVPYQDTEQYEEQVPYQDTEYYTEEVPYYDTETYVEQVPYTRNVPYQDTETYYENEYQCRDVTRYQRECKNEPVCHTEPSTERQCSVEHICRTDHTGREVCVDKEVCRQVGGGGRQVCHDNQVCRDIPVNDRQCGYVQVPHTRTVTKYHEVTEYRSETRTRTVTKYRTETRQRTVTKYRSETRTRTVTKNRTETRTRQVTRHRTETRCCKPETYQAFDHQYKVAVVLNFPSDAQLLAGESEDIDLALTGTEASPDLKIEARSRIFKYEVVNKKVTRAAISADLKRVPAFTPDMLGKGTIMNLKLLPAQGAAQKVVFVDTGLRARVATEYTLTVQEAMSGQVVHQSKQASDGNQKAEIAVPVALSPTLDYVLKLDVARAGINLTAPVQFTETAKHEFRRFTPEEVGASTVSSLVISESGDMFLARFKDVGTNEFIETIYRVTLSNAKTGETVFTQDMNAKDVTSELNNATLQIPKTAIDAKIDYKLSVRILRKGIVLTAPVDFEITGRIDLSDWTIAYKDESRVELVKIVGSGTSAKVVVRDQTIIRADVKTSYEIELKNASGGSLGRTKLAREKFQKDSATPEFQVTLDWLTSNDQLNRFATSGQQVILVARVIREGAKIGKVEFVKTATLKVP